MKSFKKSVTYSGIATLLMLALNPVTHAQQQGTVTDREGNSYKTVVINGKTWMAENLRATQFNDGTPIKTANIGAQDAGSAMYWYENNKNSAQSKKYGALYNWKVVTSKNVCPTNWHVSTLEEWNELINSYPKSDKARGEKDGKHAAYPLRATGDSWPNNQAANNSSGFSALPGGWIANAGHMTFVGERGAWWAPKNNNTQPAFGKIAMGDDGAWTLDANVIDILTIRCVKDAGGTQSAAKASVPVMPPKFKLHTWAISGERDEKTPYWMGYDGSRKQVIILQAQPGGDKSLLQLAQVSLGDGTVALKLTDQGNSDAYLNVNASNMVEIWSKGKELPPQSARFKIRPPVQTKATANFVSFESAAKQGYYLRHQGFDVKISPMETNEVFLGDATWLFQSVN